MTAPKRRLSKTRKKSRRGHDFLSQPMAGVCSNCGELKQPHRICRHCGYYNDTQYKDGTEE